MVRAGNPWFAWMVAAFCAAIPAIAQAASEDVPEDTEGVAEAESPIVWIGGVSEAEFPFITVVADGGTEQAGGWQAAGTTLRFVDGRGIFFSNAWSCQVFVWMPIRHAVHGVITPQKAAQVTAAASSSASTLVMHRRPHWIRASFCSDFATELETQLNTQMTGLGAKASAR
ncbi:hypothetical protein [Polyangium jinanense]|uniref:Uncharacterized protein n=1 Tax=Polyangium jinanense TaxID=2829994 RepID=A0A9X4AR60_9BACT|nr:hypothetical protein [Polyangium jinanense]MDC3953119.1 hypothetical protein [Polyangium jinanense]MDC3979760.1 hypothetical protein [Polyangium jinanense]